MIDLETMLSFLTAAVVLAFAPGPDNIFVLTQSAQRGAKAGISVTFGLATGLIFHTALVVLGVAALLAVSPAALWGLKLAGAGYLLYLAWGAYHAMPAALNSEELSLSGFAYFRRGIVMNTTNPKVSIFFLAFLPQFVNPDRADPSGQVMQLALLFALVTIVVFSLIAVASGWIGRKLFASIRGQMIMNRVTAIVFTGLAVRLLIPF